MKSKVSLLPLDFHLLLPTSFHSIILSFYLSIHSLINFINSTTEELADAKERNVQLTARLQQREADLDEARTDLENLAREKERLRERVNKSNESKTIF